MELKMRIRSSTKGNPDLNVKMEEKGTGGGGKKGWTE